MRTFSMKDPDYYRDKVDNAGINIDIAQLKYEIATRKVKLAELNEMKKKSDSKSGFNTQMGRIKNDIENLEEEIRKLKERYK